jgi:hypothetical protein
MPLRLLPLVAWVIIRNSNSWRNCYYLMIGFQSLNLAYLFCFYHPPAIRAKHAHDGKSRLQLLREFDWIGLFLFVTGCTLFIIGVSWGGTLHPWASATTVAPIVVGFCALVGLGFYERYGNMREALFPPRLFKQTRQYVRVILLC